MSATVVQVVEWVFLAYFVGINLAYLGQNLVAVYSIRRYVRSAAVDDDDPAYSSVHLPISLVVPAYNESTSIVTSIKALLQLEYPDFEVVVVNDGSKDDTLEKLIQAFALYPYPEAYRNQVPCKPIRATYRSARYRNLRVVDKENGGCKADALNAGINICRYPLVTVVDADGILQRDSLTRAVRPFLDRPETVAAGGAVRIANGCRLRDGFLEEVGLPRNFLALVQVIEYLRAFLFGRMGWEPLGAVMIVSGAFGVFRRTTLIEVGGFNPKAVGEDMELVTRIHRKLKQQRQALSHRLHSGSRLLDRRARNPQGPREPAHPLASRPRPGADAQQVADREPARRHRLVARRALLPDLRAHGARARGARRGLLPDGSALRRNLLARSRHFPADVALARHAAVHQRDHARGVFVSDVPQASRAR